MVAANKLAGIVICISKDHFRDGKKLVQHNYLVEQLKFLTTPAC